MKINNIKYLSYIVCGLLTLTSVTSCHLDDPEPPTQEELYLRAFIQKYGLIDPKQDWNMAERKTITVNVGEHADRVYIYVKCGKDYYRVGAFADISGTVEIGLDIPEGEDQLLVAVDGRMYETLIGATLDATAPSRAASRAGESDGINWQNWYEDNDHNRNTIDIPYKSSTDDKNVPLNRFFYGPNPYTGGEDLTNYDTTNIPGEANALTLTPNGNQPMYAYAQMHNTHNAPVSGNSQYNDRQPTSFLLKFTTTTTEAGQIYLRVMGDPNYVDELINITPGIQDHEYLLSNVPGGAWFQMCFKSISGTTVLSNLQIEDFIPDDMAWLLVAEDLGATDDFDFNDVIIQIKSLSTNRAALKFEVEKWQVIEDDDEHLVLHTPSRGDSRAGEVLNKLTITSMCAGGVLDSYLHFRLDDGTDYTLCPGNWDLTTQTPADVVGCEWHDWFDDYVKTNTKNGRPMLNTGLNRAKVKSATIIVPEAFSMSRYSQIFVDYDGTADSFEGEEYSYNSNNSYMSPWSYLTDGTFKNNIRIHGFYMTVGEKEAADCDRVLGGPKEGAAPQMFLIPDAGKNGRWKWPHERVSITSVYTGFGKWVKDKTDNNWYKETPVTTNVKTVEGKNIQSPLIDRLTFQPATN